MKNSYERVFRKAGGPAGEGKKGNGSRAGKTLLVILAVFTLLPFLFLEDCWCGESAAPREDAPAEVQVEEGEAGDQPSQGSRATSPSQEAI